MDDRGAKSVRERYDAARKATRGEQQRFWQSVAYLAGDQWLMWNPILQRLARRPAQGMIQCVDNRLLPATVRVMAKLHRRPLAFECPRSSGDDASLVGARLGEAVLRHTAREQDWESVRAEADMLAWQG